MDAETWYFRTSKLALALAIIHSKPSHKSSREYTEHLATLVSEKESKWRSKVEALEAEVLQLHQKLLLCQMCSGSFKSGNLSFQLPAQEPRSSENTVMEDSGCDLSHEQETQPSQSSQNFMESCTPSPFPLLPLVKTAQVTSGIPLSSHMQFLQHLFEVKNLTESSSMITDLINFEKDYSTVSHSVFQLLEGLITFYRNLKLPFSSFWTEAVSTLARVISDCNLSKHILKQCSKKLDEFEKTLLQILLESNHTNRFQVQHCVSHSLVTLGSCSLLRKSIVSLLLSEVNSFADHLRAAHQVQASYDVIRYENIFSLLWVLDQLLQKETKENTPSTGHDDQETKKFLQELDETILQLVDAFPLFAFYLWRLGILMNSTETETVGNNLFT
ncbi:meiosis-specific protein MEI4 [Ctenodactylus gundi]